MPILKKRGQLSLEFVLLLFGVIVAGTFVAVNLADQNPAYLGDSASKIKKESLGLFIGKGVNFSSTTTVNSSGYNENNSSNLTTNETENITTEINNSITNNTVSNDTSKNISTDNNTNENLTTNETIKKPNLFIENLSVVENGSVIACHCFRERVQNKGEDTNLRNQFQHRCGKCKNGTNVDIVAVIGNNGTANCNSFQVIMYDNDIQIYNNTFQNLNVNETLTITVPYEISTSKGCKHQNKGESQQNRYGGCCCERVFNHTITVKVIATNDSNPNDNSASVVISIEKEKGCNNCNGKNNNNNNTIFQPADVEGLFIKVMGNGDLEFYKEPLSNATTIGPNIDISVKGNHDYRYNLNGVINNGKIKVNGNGNLIIGDIKSINNLYLRLNGDSDINFNDVPEIKHIYFITNKGFNSLTPNLGRITGNVNVNLDNKNIDTIKVDVINGGGELKLNYAKINDITINKIIGTLMIDNSNISNLNIQLNKGDVIIYNSTITNINLVNNGDLILYNSKILGGNIINNGDIYKVDSYIGANING
ncbi:Protein of unknown function DUF361 [Methanocaldococcus vulcanius M7]|uniref:Uncharacterized protein n=1 Tax=Methanocaldococcus vulcanius (strain ATCC 700851 / DSM 12094 / M7) TaxID=579137 RepID=C9RDI7_METVM|nr:class III signal peptide-containing protein [Methanocaldococcus vulcanius]ACX73366.1 Protein of unknown function DUF361 [Methanocaldococcus vulcanius M7]